MLLARAGRTTTNGTTKSVVWRPEESDGMHPKFQKDHVPARVGTRSVCTFTSHPLTLEPFGVCPTSCRRASEVAYLPSGREAGAGAPRTRRRDPPAGVLGRGPHRCWIDGQECARERPKKKCNVSRGGVAFCTTANCHRLGFQCFTVHASLCTLHGQNGRSKMLPMALAAKCALCLTDL